MEDTNVTTKPTETEAMISVVAQSCQSVFEVIFGIVYTENWKQFTLPEQKYVREVVEQYFAAASVIREKFDSDVWKGHANGTVDPSVTSVRKQREGDTPGKKAEKPTADSVLAKRLKK